MSKVGFGFSKKVVKKDDKLGAAVSGIEKEKGPDFISGIAENAIESTEPVAVEGKKIIAKQENTFQVGVGKKKELYLPDQEDLQDTGDRFEAAPDSLAQSGEGVIYGLNKRARPTEESTAGERDAGDNMTAQLLNHDKNTERNKFKEECKALPDHCDEEGYESMPIEMFGEAMLRGMGWEEGKPLGKNAKGIIAPVEYVHRQQLLGLGAAPAAPQESKKRILHSGESRVRADLVLPTGPDGKVRNLKTLDEKLVERVKPGVHPGKVMVIVCGQHSGMLAKVLSVEKPEGRSERATVVLSHSDEKLQIRSNELAEKDTEEAEKARVKLVGKGKKSERREDRKTTAPSKDRAPKDSGPTWLTTHIKVKIISKTLDGGRLYLKKGEIVDVSGRYSCSVLIDQTGKTVHDLAQHQLETAPPKPGGRIQVVLGKLKGHRGKLIERNSAQEEGSIQLNEDFTFHKLPLDSLSEYVGAEDDLD